jgi:hypothetical protein
MTGVPVLVYQQFWTEKRTLKSEDSHPPPASNHPCGRHIRCSDGPRFDVISVKQMSSARRAPTEGATTINLPLFLITLPRTAKSQEIFKLPSLCHNSIKVEAYKSRSATTARRLATSRQMRAQRRHDSNR